MAEPKTIRTKNWLPLESNPDLMNKYIKALGAEAKWCFHDVYGVDEGLLAMVPQPCLAVLLLFPISEVSEKHKAEEAKLPQTVSPNLYYIKQTVGNACGTIGLIHSLLNVREQVNLDETKFFAKFYEETKGMNALERAAALEANTDIEEEHQQVASDPTASSSIPDLVNLHFIAFVEKDGALYELDGRKEGPINHGPSSPETLLTDSVKIVKQFMARDPEEIHFNMVALGPAQ